MVGGSKKQSQLLVKLDDIWPTGIILPYFNQVSFCGESDIVLCYSYMQGGCDLTMLQNLYKNHQQYSSLSKQRKQYSPEKDAAGKWL